MNFSISLYNGTQIEQIAYSPIVLSSGIINLTASSVRFPGKPSAGRYILPYPSCSQPWATGASAVTATPLPPPGITAFGATPYSSEAWTLTARPRSTSSSTTAASAKGGSYTVPIRVSYLNNLEEHSTSTKAVRLGHRACQVASTRREGLRGDNGRRHHGVQEAVGRRRDNNHNPGVAVGASLCPVPGKDGQPQNARSGGK